MLDEWDSSETLCTAGLCHATYGTDRFHKSLLELSQRPELEAVIGSEAEALVYFYCACDVTVLYRSLREGAEPRYRDRFTTLEWPPAPALLRAYLEMTFANHLETARRDAGFRELARPFYDDLFPRSRDYVTTKAFDAYLAVYGHGVASLQT